MSWKKEKAMVRFFQFFQPRFSPPPSFVLKRRSWFKSASQINATISISMQPLTWVPETGPVFVKLPQKMSISMEIIPKRLPAAAHVRVGHVVWCGCAAQYSHQTRRSPLPFHAWHYPTHSTAGLIGDCNRFPFFFCFVHPEDNGYFADGRT